VNKIIIFGNSWVATRTYFSPPLYYAQNTSFIRVCVVPLDNQNLETGRHFHSDSAPFEYAWSLRFFAIVSRP